LENQTDGLSGSDIVTDRIVASIEIVTPKLTVDELFAKKIKAEQIELPAGAWLEALSGGGLESINSQIADLRSQILGINDKIASSSAVASSSATLEDKTKSLIDQLLARELEDASESATRAQNGLSLKSLNVDGLSEFEDSVRVKGNGLFENLLTVLDTLTTQNFIANGLSTFFGETIFKDKVEFEKNATFASDTGGVATIKKNAERVEVEFVNASVSFDEAKDEKGNVEDTEEQEIKFFQENYSYIIVNKSKKGFVIVLNKKAKDDVTFTWTALQVKDARKVQSRIPKIN
jgi:hypothetical protein